MVCMFMCGRNGVTLKTTSFIILYFFFLVVLPSMIKSQIKYRFQGPGSDHESLIVHWLFIIIYINVPKDKNRKDQSNY